MIWTKTKDALPQCGEGTRILGIVGGQIRIFEMARRGCLTDGGSRIEGCEAWAYESDVINLPVIHAVFAKYEDRNRLLGYVIAESEEDVQAYYEDKKAYGLEIETIEPVRIPAGFAAEKSELIRQRDALKKQLQELESRLTSSVS